MTKLFQGGICLDHELCRGCVLFLYPVFLRQRLALWVLFSSNKALLTENSNRAHQFVGLISWLRGFCSVLRTRNSSVLQAQYSASITSAILEHITSAVWLRHRMITDIFMTRNTHSCVSAPQKIISYLDMVKCWTAPYHVGASEFMHVANRVLGMWSPLGGTVWRRCD